MSYCFVQTFHFLSLFPSPQSISRQPRPQGAFPWLRKWSAHLQSQGKAPWGQG